MNRLSGAEAFVRMLQLHGVRHVFGLCGDTSLPLYDALYRLDHGISHVLTRDERSAAYMADAYARVTGRVGVCEGPSGGGATYILPGVVEANESSIPVLARDHRHRGRRARTLRPDRARPGGPVPSADQVDAGDRSRRPDPGRGARRVPPHDHRPARRGAHRPAFRRAKRPGRRGGSARRCHPRHVSRPACGA